MLFFVSLKKFCPVPFCVLLPRACVSGVQKSSRRLVTVSRASLALLTAIAQPPGSSCEQTVLLFPWRAVELLPTLHFIVLPSAGPRSLLHSWCVKAFGAYRRTLMILKPLLPPRFSICSRPLFQAEETQKYLCWIGQMQRHLLSCLQNMSGCHSESCQEFLIAMPKTERNKTARKGGNELEGPCKGKPHPMTSPHLINSIAFCVKRTW